MKIRRISQPCLRNSVPPLCLLLITASRHQKWASASNTHRSWNPVRPGCYYCCLVDIKEKKKSNSESHTGPIATCTGTDFTLHLDYTDSRIFLEDKSHT